MDYDKVLNEWFDNVIDISDKYREKADEQNDYTYKKGYNNGAADGLLLATSVLSRLEKKYKRKELKDTSEIESDLMHEGLILLLDRYTNIIKINNVTNELTPIEKDDIENKIVKIKSLLEDFNCQTIE